MKDHEKTGSGHQYFDLTLPENNFQIKIEVRGTKYTEQERYENMSGIAGYLIWEPKDEYKENIDFLSNFLEKNDPVYQSRLVYREIERTSGMAQYQNNRYNFMHLMAQLVTPKREQEERELMKKTVHLGVSLGLHPLEKDMRFGHTPFALCLGNSSASFEMIKFFASLHPDSFTDLSEEGETAMQLVLRANRKKEIVDWVVSSIPLDAIENNIKSIMKKKKTSGKASDAIDALTSRLEQSQLNESIVKGPERKAANKL